MQTCIYFSTGNIWLVFLFILCGEKEVERIEKGTIFIIFVSKQRISNWINPFRSYWNLCFVASFYCLTKRFELVSLLTNKMLLLVILFDILWRAIVYLLCTCIVSLCDITHIIITLHLKSYQTIWRRLITQADTHMMTFDTNNVSYTHVILSPLERSSMDAAFINVQRTLYRVSRCISKGAVPQSYSKYTHQFQMFMHIFRPPAWFTNFR